MISRRNFVSGLIAAPVIVRFESLMPIKKIYWGEHTLDHIPFSIEKITVTAPVRILKASYSLDLTENEILFILGRI